MNIIFKITLLLSLFVCTNCATIISGSQQMVEITSEPSAATVFINGIEAGNTPVQKNLKRNQEYALTLKLDGYKTYKTKLERKFNAWYIGNVVFGGLIGIIVDPATGAMYKLKPEQINGAPKAGTTYKTRSENLFINISLDIDSNAEKIGQLEKSN